MSLPKTFQFSATSLQDYVDCPRRFQLRYLLRIAWPAPEAEPLDERERRDRLGREFHLLAHQHLLGLPIERLSPTVEDPDLARWWQAYLAYVPTLRAAQVLPEVGLSTPLAGYRMVAQYDALALRAGGPGDAGEPAPATVLIMDWKTYRQRPERAWLAQRLQTRVYPLVLVQAGAALVRSAWGEDSGRLIEPEQVEMRYWLAEYPQSAEAFVYDAATYQADLDYLASLVGEIVERANRSAAGPATAVAFGDVWPLTADWGHCRFCRFRSLCERGSTAGPLAEFLEGDPDQPVSGAADPGFDLDWGQVQEIVY